MVRGESMVLQSYIIVFIGCIIFTITIGLVASMCSCYYPWLLSWRAYYVVKSERMRKILLSGQYNRDRATRTAPEDRNKMALVGCVMWAGNLFFTVGTWSILIFLIVTALFLSNAEARALGERAEPFFYFFFNKKYFYFMFGVPVLSLLDFWIGKWIHSKKS